MIALGPQFQKPEHRVGDSYQVAITSFWASVSFSFKGRYEDLSQSMSSSRGTGGAEE